jgi:HPt (histidine-containing phosphotransfer) domain-containing protein
MDDDKSIPLNVAEGLEEFDNNIEFYTDLVNGFLEHVEKRISVMEQAVIDEDIKALQDETHAIKGGAANLNANDLSNAAYKLEEIVKSNTPERADKGLRVIKKEFFRLKEFLLNHDALNFL